MQAEPTLRRAEGEHAAQAFDDRRAVGGRKVIEAPEDIKLDGRHIVAAGENSLVAETLKRLVALKCLVALKRLVGWYVRCLLGHRVRPGLSFDIPPLKVQPSEVPPFNAHEQRCKHISPTRCAVDFIQ